MYHPRNEGYLYEPEPLTRTAAAIDIDPAWRMPISVSLESLPPDLIQVRFERDRRIHYALSVMQNEGWIRDAIVHSMVCTADLFCFTKHAFPGISGVCDFWVGERAEGPGLCYTGNTQSHICIPDTHYLESDGFAHFRAWPAQDWIPWQARKSQLFWRGASTGRRDWVFASSWSELPRLALCLRAAEAKRQELVDIGLSNLVQLHDPAERALITAARLVKGHVPISTFMHYRWAVDVDGNSCTWSSLITKFLMQNTVVKVDSRIGFRQWYYDRLVPWKNYVPLGSSMAELDEIVEWLLNNPGEAEAIAGRGRDLGLELSMEKVRVDVANKIRDYLTNGPPVNSPPGAVSAGPQWRPNADLAVESTQQEAYDVEGNALNNPADARLIAAHRSLGVPRQMAPQNVALGRRSWQSSVSPWSKKPTIVEDAMGATNGDPAKDYGFCTSEEANPWWQVDLEKLYEIDEIRIYNRKGPIYHQVRASPLLVETSVDGENWTEFYKMEPGVIFGADDKQHEPLVCVASRNSRGRYVRITVVTEKTFLHLAEVEVYASEASAASGLPAASDLKSPPPAPSEASEPPAANAAAAPSAEKSAAKRGGWLSLLGW